MNLRLYIDEIGNSDLQGASDDPNVRFLALTGITARRRTHDEKIAPALEHLKRHFPAHRPDVPVILHRRDILRREGVFAVLRDDEDKQAAFDDELADLIKRMPYLANTVQIDKKLHLERYSVWHFDPYHYCLCCLIERYVMLLERHGLRGDVVIEPRFKKADKRVKASFERIYTKGTDNISPARVQHRLLSKDIGFFDKRANVAGLQLADLLAHPSARFMRFRRDGIEEPDDYGTRLAQLMHRYKYARCPKTGKIDGWGMKWLP